MQQSEVCYKRWVKAQCYCALRRTKKKAKTKTSQGTFIPLTDSEVQKKQRFRSRFTVSDLMCESFFSPFWLISKTPLNYFRKYIMLQNLSSVSGEVSLSCTRAISLSNLSSVSAESSPLSLSHSLSSTFPNVEIGARWFNWAQSTTNNFRETLPDLKLLLSRVSSERKKRHTWNCVVLLCLGELI